VRAENCLFAHLLPTVGTRDHLLNRLDGHHLFLTPACTG